MLIGGYLYRTEDDYKPLALDYHYMLEWDLVKDYEFTAKHQVRYFDQGGQEGWDKFMETKAVIEEAQESGVVENLSAGCRAVRLDDWELGWPTLPPNLTC